MKPPNGVADLQVVGMLGRKWGKQHLVARIAVNHFTKLDDAILGPESILGSSTIRQKPNVSAVSGPKDNHVFVRRNISVRQRIKWHKRVILSMDDQTGFSNQTDQFQGAGFFIVVVSTCKPTVGRGIAFVEIPDSTYFSEATDVVNPRIDLVLCPDSPSQTGHKTLTI